MISETDYKLESKDSSCVSGTQSDFSLADIYNKVYNVLLEKGKRLGFSSEQLEDIIQQMFLGFAEKKVNFVNIINVEAFVTICFKRKLIDYHRAMQKAKDRLIYLPKETVNSQQDVLEDKEDLLLQTLKIKNAYDKLPERYKTVIFCKFAMGLTNDQIVAKTGWTIRTVYNNLHNAVKLLRNEINA